MQLLIRLVCFAGSALSIFSCYGLRPSPAGADAQMKLRMRHFGRLIFLTVQTNIINTAYFGLCVFASLSGFAIGTAPHLWFSLCCLDRTLESTVTACFPLSFALGGLLTPVTWLPFCCWFDYPLVQIVPQRCLCLPRILYPAHRSIALLCASVLPSPTVWLFWPQ